MLEVLGALAVFAGIANGIANARKKLREQNQPKIQKADEPYEELKPLTSTDLKVMNRWFSGDNND